MVLIAEEAMPAGSKPSAAVAVRISTGEGHDYGAAAPLSTKTSSGEREVQLSCRNRSNLSGRLGPFLQNNYPHASLELQQRRLLCAREASCLLLRLPPSVSMALVRRVCRILCPPLETLFDVSPSV